MEPLKNVDNKTIICPQSIEEKLEEAEKDYKEDRVHSEDEVWAILSKNMDLIYKIEYTDSAINDLNRIVSYLSDYGNPMIITNFKNEIKRSLGNTKFFSKSHTIVFHQNGYDDYKLIIKNYIFINHIDKNNCKIIIFRIFHELEDYQNKLGY